MRILFLTSAHSSIDDRIYYHQAKSMCNDNQVAIYSTYSGISSKDDLIELTYDDRTFSSRKLKIEAFSTKCEEYLPDVVICSEPIPIIGAHQQRKKNKSSKYRILYDVTEFYPSKKNLQGSKGLKRLVKTIAMVQLNKKAASLVDGFIFGEHFKSLFYKAHFKKKQSVYLPYYQDLSYFPLFQLPPSEFVIGYSGKFSEEKGIFRFAEVLNQFAKHQNSENWRVVLIGWFADKRTEEEFNFRTKDLQIELKENMPFESYCKSLYDISVFMDLRDSDAENNLCVPIKLFTYASAGRPVIYSALQAIESAYPNEKFITNKRTEDLQGMVEKLSQYYENRSELEIDCDAAFHFARNHQWDIIKEDFIRFVTHT